MENLVCCHWTWINIHFMMNVREPMVMKAKGCIGRLYFQPNHTNPAVSREDLFVGLPNSGTGPMTNIPHTHTHTHTPTYVLPSRAKVYEWESIDWCNGGLGY